LTPGAQIGPYTIQSLIGAGGMGEVYRAQDRRLARIVALKLIRRTLVHDETSIDRLLREATVASALNHPNIVTIYETGVVERDRYVAMEFVDGVTLRALAEPGLPVGRVVAIARQIAEALAVAHAAQIVHRDIKPENVMVRPDGYVKLLDFGLARLQPDALAAGQTTAATEAGMILGTIGYMAPEQARGDKVGAEADIFALGVLLYELVTGRHPFMAASHLGTLHALMWETPEPPSLINAELPRAIDQLILEAIQKDPRLRPGATDIMYRLTLAHDSAVAAALSESPPPAQSAVPARIIVGRDTEIGALLDELAAVRNNRARLVFIGGEAGMGKTTLVDAFVRYLDEGREPVRVGRGRCSERLAGSEAYLPILEVLDSLQRSEQHGNLTRLIRAVAPSWYAQIMPPASDDSSAARLAVETVGGSQERLKREILTLFDEVGRIQPLMVWIDDAHWADPSTIDLIGYLARRLEASRVLLIVTARPSELAQTRHPLLPLKLDLLARGLCREIVPGLLDEEAIERYVVLQFPEHTFPPGVAGIIHQRTDGNPLFVADLIRDLRRRQIVRQQDGRWIMAEDLSTLERELPESIRSLIQRKMDALEDVDRRLLASAAVQGVDFDSAVLSSALEIDEELVEGRLDRLEREHALIRFVGEAESADRSLTLRYRFAHHVYQKAFYESLRVTRRAALSRSIAETLIKRTGGQPGEGAAEIAILLETARDGVRAAEYWNQAAQAAARLYAHEETVRLAQRGLALLAAERDTPERAAAELGLQMTYGLAIKTSRGYAVAAVGAAYARARELARKVSDPGRVIPVLIGLSAHHVVSGEIRTAYEIGREMLSLFTGLGDPNLQMIGEWSLGAALFHLGELERGHEHLARGLELHDPAFHGPRVWQTGIEPGIFCRCEFSRTLMLRGYPEQGVAAGQEAVRQARALDHPQPLAFALLFQLIGIVAQRTPRAAPPVFEELARLCRAHGIAQELQWAVPIWGRAQIELGETETGIRQLEEGLAAHTITRSALLRPFYLTLLAGGLIRIGRYDAAERALEESASVAAATGQPAYESERARLQGTVLSRRGGQETRAEESFREALAIARSQHARWFELRSARGYADLLVHQGRTAEARALLQPVLDWFTEGFSTVDYGYAETLLRNIDGD
jgi:tRNA A-37 threonylcarbamoyl transferase component Bud32/tetratricopeptide (TPR) repeat protein